MGEDLVAVKVGAFADLHEVPKSFLVNPKKDDGSAGIFTRSWR